MTPLLAETYNKLNAASNHVQIIFVSCDRSEEQYFEYLAEMPWIAVPFGDSIIDKLSDKHGVEGIPALYIYNEKGEKQDIDAITHFLTGEKAYPFDTITIKKIEEEIARKKAERIANQTLENLLATGSRDFVINHKGEEIKVHSLQENTVIGLYFSAHWCPPCRKFTPVLAKLYDTLKADGKKFEIVFISSDKDKASWEEYYNEMPWLALPYEDRDTKSNLSDHFDVEGIPTLILLNSQGKLITADGRSAVSKGAKAFPFTEERLAELDAEFNKFVETLPKEIIHNCHEHPLKLLPSVYFGAYQCNICTNSGDNWVYHCDPCQFDAHIDCLGQK